MQVKIVNKSGFDLPKYETVNSAGMDIRSTENVELEPLERRIVKTGLFLELPKGIEAQVRPRSGMSIKHGVTVLNSPGTIDADYRGEVGVILVNLSNESFTISSGDRIAQMVFAKHEQVRFIAVQKLSSTERGSGGFGSTGTK